MMSRPQDLESDKDSVHEHEYWSLDRLKKLGVESRGENNWLKNLSVAHLSHILTSWTFRYSTRVPG
jgi:hypothetical protein